MGFFTRLDGTVVRFPVSLRKWDRDQPRALIVEATQTYVISFDGSSPGDALERAKRDGALYEYFDQAVDGSWTVRLPEDYERERYFYGEYIADAERAS